MDNSTPTQDSQGQTFDLGKDLCDLPFADGKKLLMRDKSFDGHVLSAGKRTANDHTWLFFGREASEWPSLVRTVGVATTPTDRNVARYRLFSKNYRANFTHNLSFFLGDQRSKDPN